MKKVRVKKARYSIDKLNWRKVGKGEVLTGYNGGRVEYYSPRVRKMVLIEPYAPSKELKTFVSEHVIKALRKHEYRVVK